MEGNQSLSEIITDIYRTFFDFLRNISSLAVIEAKQVKWTLVRMGITIFAVILSILFTWAGICSIIIIFLTMQGFSLIYSVFSVTALNLFLLISSIIIMLSQNENMFFSATSKQLGLAIKHSKDTTNE